MKWLPKLLGGKKEIALNYATLERAHVQGTSELTVKGTSFRQSELRQLGLGSNDFILVPEPTNKHDSMAIKVLGLKGESALPVGYLAKDFFGKTTVHKVATKLLKDAKVLTLRGDTFEGDGLFVMLSFPALDVLAKQFNEASPQIMPQTPREQSESEEKVLTKQETEERALLKARKVSFPKGSLSTEAFSAGGSYVGNPSARDQENLVKFLEPFRDGDKWSGVAFLVPEENGKVGVQINGQSIDHLTKQSAQMAHPLLEGSTPVKCSIMKIVSRDGKQVRGHVTLTSGRDYSK